MVVVARDHTLYEKGMGTCIIYKFTCTSNAFPGGSQCTLPTVNFCWGAYALTKNVAPQLHSSWEKHSKIPVQIWHPKMPDSRGVPLLSAGHCNAHRPLPWPSDVSCLGRVCRCLTQPLVWAATDGMGQIASPPWVREFFLFVLASESTREASPFWGW